jgi:hypothetical protein
VGASVTTRLRAGGAAAAGLFLVTALLACSDLPARMRRHTYPPGFSYISREQLDSAMWQLARQVRDLDRLVREPPAIDAGRRAAILQVLTEMDRTTAGLRQGWESSHPLIDADVDKLRDDVALARAAVAHDPPRYYLAGSIAGACLYCHR